MAFQTTIRADIGSGYPGDLALHGPVSASPVIVDPGAGDVADLVIGRVFSLDTSTDGITMKAVPGSPGTEGYALSGILVQRTEYVNRSDLGTSLTLLTGEIAEVLHRCDGVFVIAANPGLVRIGNYVIFDKDTGEIDTVAPGGTLPVGWAILDGATVVRDRASDPGGLTIISLRGPSPVGDDPDLA